MSTDLDLLSLANKLNTKSVQNVHATLILLCPNQKGLFLNCMDDFRVLERRRISEKTGLCLQKVQEGQRGTDIPNQQNVNIYHLYLTHKFFLPLTTTC